MPILIFDDKEFKFYVRARPNETFTPDEEIQKLNDELAVIRGEYQQVYKKLSNFLPKLTLWSRKHDVDLEKKLRAKEEKQKEAEPKES